MKRPSNKEEIKKKLDEELEKEIQFNKKFYKPMPNFDKSECIKLNKKMEQLK